ncbi:hypothetical protein SIN09_07455 [Streptomyces sp. F8]|uniref:hypothetical protein n=1 Tax=Streptomyces sp. F8 TaxID=1436085 RepID=UPI0029CBEF97|nr:hypothetical protein [Streptomyces sp. F8]MDX6759283.1 hypothetical protein [Streptomyces sp. F8]
MRSTAIKSAPGAADSPLSATPLVVEQALSASPLRTTLSRPGSFAGNARGWARSLRSGRPGRLPSPGGYCDPVHQADRAEAAFGRRGGYMAPFRASRAYQWALERGVRTWVS